MCSDVLTYIINILARIYEKMFNCGNLNKHYQKKLSNDGIAIDNYLIIKSGSKLRSREWVAHKMSEVNIKMFRVLQIIVIKLNGFNFK